jgi:hypothetical protein
MAASTSSSRDSGRRHADEDVLARVERFVLVAQQPAAPPKDHRPIAAAQDLDVERFSHATGVTPKPDQRVTGGEMRRCWRWHAHRLSKRRSLD